MEEAPTILVVEDDFYINKLLCDIFTMGGYKVLQAPSVAAAARVLAGTRPDLITLDLNLPDISGQTLLQSLRERPDTAGLPVVVITSQLPVAGRISRQAEAVVEKPFDLSHLLATVQRVVPPAAPQLDCRAA